MDIIACGSRPSRTMAASKASPGTVWQNPIIQTPNPALFQLGLGALRAGRAHRLAYHRSDRREVHITSGIGHSPNLGCVRSIRYAPATPIWIPPGEALARRHAQARHRHIAMQEHKGAVRHTWLEPVTDAQNTEAEARGLTRRGIASRPKGA